MSKYLTLLMLFCGGLWLYIPSQNVSAQEQKIFLPKGTIRVELKPLVERARPGAPLPVDIKFENYTSRLLEGTLIIEGKEHDTVVYRHLIPDMVLTETLNSQVRHVLLPIQFYHSPIALLDLQMYFSTEKELIDLDEHPIRVAERGGRNFSVASCTADSRGILGDSSEISKRDNFISKWLNFKENGRESTPNELFTGQIYRTAFSTLHRQELPENPVAFTAFDILAIWEDAFRNMTSRQLKALEQWVYSGGSLLLVADGKLSVDHLSALNRLCKNEDEALPFFSLNSKSSLQWNTDQTELVNRTGLPYVAGHAELGRVAILSPEELQTLMQTETSVREKLYFFLWKYRKTIAKQLVQSSELNIEELFHKETLYSHWGSQRYLNGQLYNQGTKNFNKKEVDYFLQQHWNEEYSYLPETQIGAKTSIYHFLMPQEFATVPPLLMMSVMFGYLMIVGPGEYFFLGMYKKRKWTWITFPVMTLAVTMGTLWMINSYMKFDIPEKSLSVVDIGSQGQVLRSNSVECYLSQRPQTRHVEISGELVSPIHKTDLNDQFRASFQNGGASNWMEDPGEVSFVGNVAGKHELVRKHAKWTPEYATRFSIGTTQLDLPSIPWEQITLDSLKQGGQQSAVYEMVQNALPETPHAVFLLHEGKLQNLGLKSDSSQVQPWAVGSSALVDGVVRNFEELFSKRFAYTRLLSHLSPRPGEFINNMALVDSLNPDQWCLLVILESNQDIVIQRRLFTEENSLL